MQWLISRTLPVRPIGIALSTCSSQRGSVSRAYWIMSVSVTPGRTPLTRSSNRERIRVSRTNRPSAEGVTTSPSRPLMENVDSSTRVTTPSDRPRPVTLPLKVHGSLTGATLPDRCLLPNHLVGTFLGVPQACGRWAPEPGLSLWP